MRVRVGIGYDLHPLKEGRELILGGIRIPYEKGLYGHSDADCLIHAICDALLGGMGKGDIGEYFPDTDPRFCGMASIILLEQVMRMVKEEGYAVCNIDTILVADLPRITPYKDAISERLAHTMGIDKNRITIKAKTTNGLCLFASEGIAAYAIVCLSGD